MTNFFNFNIVEVGLFIVGAGYLYTFWKEGGIKSSRELDKINASLIAGLKEQNQFNSQKISELTTDVGVLKGQLAEKDKQITLLQTLTKTTPEQQNYMNDMRKFTVGVADYMASSTKTLGEISVFMHQLNTKA